MMLLCSKSERIRVEGSESDLVLQLPVAKL